MLCCPDRNSLTVLSVVCPIDSNDTDHGNSHATGNEVENLNNRTNKSVDSITHYTLITAAKKVSRDLVMWVNKLNTDSLISSILEFISKSLVLAPCSEIGS